MRKPITFTNPLQYDDGEKRTDPDPFVMRYRGRYYCYSSGEEQVNVSVSEDMITWRRLEAAMRLPERAHYWAPCVYYHNGTFYMYVSNRPTGSQDPHEEVLQLAVSNVPEGPFETVHQFFTTFSIDADVVPDGHGGWTMFYSVNDVTGLDETFTGTSIVGDELLALDSLAGEPKPTVVPTLDEEIFETNRFGDGRDWYTIEGATYFTRHGYAYMTYSGNAYERENYFIGYSRAPLDGGRPHELSWEKFPNDHTWQPLIRRNEHVEGTGHNSIVRAPNLVDDWIVYHGRSAHEPITPGVEERVMRMDALRYFGNELATEAPTFDTQLAPRRPTVFTQFDGKELPDGWHRVSEAEISTGPNGLETGNELAQVLNDHSSSGYVAEVWLAMQRSDLGARAGFIISWVDTANYAEALVDAASSTIVIREWINGIGKELASAPIANFDCAAWHRLAVERQYQRVVVTFGDHTRVESLLSSCSGRTGLVSVHTHAQFCAFSLTDHVTLDGRDLGSAGSPFTVNQPTLISSSGVSDHGTGDLRLTASRSVDTETIHTFELLSPTSQVVIRPWDDGGANYLQLTITHSEVRIEHQRDNQVADTFSLPRSGATAAVYTAQLPDEFNVDLGMWRHRFPAPPAKELLQQIILTKARLARYEETDISQSVTNAKEQS